MGLVILFELNMLFFAKENFLNSLKVFLGEERIIVGGHNEIF